MKGNGEKPQGVYTPESLAGKYTVGVDLAHKPDVTVYTLIAKREGNKEQGERRESNGNN